MATLSPKCLKIIKTCNLYLCFLALGMCIAVPGPALLDLQHLVNTSTKSIALIYTARSFGYLVGSIAGGVVFDLLKAKQTILTVSSLVATVTILGVPWTRNLKPLAGCMVLNGISLGALDTGGNVFCLNVWGKDSGPFYQALHFTFGLGGLIGPLVAAPFVGNYGVESSTSSNFNSSSLNETLLLNNNWTESCNNDSLIPYTTLPTITYAFSAIGVFFFFVFLLFLVVCIISSSENRHEKSESTKTRERSLGFISLLVILNCILLFVETGVEIGYAQMLTTYVVKGSLKLPTSTGSFMTSVFWGSFTASRFTSVFLAIKFSNLTLIVYDIAITSLGAVILLILSRYEWAIWLSSVLLGAGIASFYPSAVGWLDTYINVTNKIASFFVIGAAAGEMVIPFTISYFIEETPDVLIYVVPASCSLSALLVLILYLILRKKETKYITQETTCYVIGGSAQT